MGINDKIYEEPLIKKLVEIKKRKVSVLIYNGINTVEKFLRANINSLTCSDITKWQLNGLQNILRYKYLGEYYQGSDNLEKTYSTSSEKIPDKSEFFQHLGFVAVESISKIAETTIKQRDADKVKIIDVIAILSENGEDDYSKELAKLYLEYYRDYQDKRAKDKESEEVKLLKLKLEAINYKLKALTYEKADIEKQIKALELDNANSLDNDTTGYMPH